MITIENKIYKILKYVFSDEQNILLETINIHSPYNFVAMYCILQRKQDINELMNNVDIIIMNIIKK